MELEERYYVIKVKDAVDLGIEGKVKKLLDAVEKHRAINGRKWLEGLFIESDWPEYEPTKAALLDRINGARVESSKPETLEDIQAAELARSRFKEPPRIGGPGSIPQDTLDQWDRDAKEQLERQTLGDVLEQRRQDHQLLSRIAELYKVMMCSAEVFTDADGTVIAYKIKTGAVHEMLGVLHGANLQLFLASGSPE